MLLPGHGECECRGPGGKLILKTYLHIQICKYRMCICWVWWGDYWYEIQFLLLGEPGGGDGYVGDAEVRLLPLHLAQHPVPVARWRLTTILNKFFTRHRSSNKFKAFALLSTHEDLSIVDNLECVVEMKNFGEGIRKIYGKALKPVQLDKMDGWMQNIFVHKNVYRIGFQEIKSAYERILS